MSRRLAACLAVLSAVTALCAGGASAKAPTGLTIFAGSSLTSLLQSIAPSETYSFGSSTTLGTQIANGAPADVFMSANTTEPALLYSEGYVEQPIDFTRNTLAVVVPKSNPANIQSIYDLESPGVTIDEAASSVPVGSYTLTVLNNMGISAAIQKNVVSQETSDANVVAKVASGQVDAGFVYLSDYITNPSELTLITVPAWAQPKITYAMAVVTKSSNQATAKAWESWILSPAIQEKFVADGFLPLTAPAPTISRMHPSSAAAGAKITVKGDNFEGTTSVVFAGGIPAAFTVKSNFALTITVPAKAKTGTFTITNPSGTVTSGTFTVT